MKFTSIFIALLASCLLLTSLAPATQAEGWGETIFWEFDAQTGTLTISGSGEIQVETKNLPWAAHKQEIKKLVIQEGITSIGSDAFLGLPQLQEIQLCQGLKSIGSQAFYLCKALETVVIPDSVEEIGRNAFSSCDNLKTMHFGAGLSAIDHNAFYASHNLATFTISENNPYFTVHQNGLYSIARKELVAIAPGYAGVHEIPEGTLSIAPWAAEFTMLTSVTIPGTVSTIPEHAFGRCENLSSVVLDEGIVTIGESAFESSILTEITFPSTVKTIGPFAFQVSLFLNKITFTGMPPTTDQSFLFTWATVYYPAYLPEWENAKIREDESLLTFVPACMGQHTPTWDVIKAPTCTEPGQHSKIRCVFCQEDVGEPGEIPATGHSYGTWTEVTAPTTEAAGLAQRVCSGCGGTEQKTLDPLPPTEPPATEETQPPATEPPATEPPATEPPVTEPPATEPSGSESTEATVTAPTTPATPDPSEDSQDPAWLPIVIIAAGGLFGLAVFFLVQKVKAARK